MSRAHPYRERHRAITKGVASPEALSICIRHCVMHRGFDYGGTEEGRFPWGESNQYSAANTWLATACITPEMADHLKTLAPELVAKKNSAEQEYKFQQQILERLAWSKEHDIARVLAEHSKGGHDNLRFRARGFNSPRQNVWQHLEDIIRRHSKFIKNVDEFIATLKINPNEQPTDKAADRARKRAIFFYNRKTRFDMERHWAKKVNICPFARRLDLNDPDTRCDVKENLAVRRWSILEFAATRRVELDIVEGKGKSKTKRNVLHRLNAKTVEALLALVARHHAALERKDKAAEPKWEEATALILADIAAVHGAMVNPSPQTKSEWNKSFYTQLKDLVLPTLANRQKRASLCAESAEKLFGIATANGADFTPENVTNRLKAAGFYDWRRDPGADFNPYPQVECLLGRRIKRGKLAGQLSPTHQGLLRRIFQEHKDVLNGLAAPDYCVVEVIGNPPRNTEQKREQHKEMLARREKRQELFEGHNLDDHGIASKRRRIQLYHQQHGRCPFTGEKMPDNPLDPNLELEHLFPEEMGGLSVDENLVLTWRTVNGVKGKRTTLQAAQAGLVVKVGKQDLRFLSWDAMLRNVGDMKWGGRKREVFAWGTNKEEHFDADGNLKVPDFGNTTRVAQLARQLRAEVARWMTVENNPDEAARRIGTPSGWLAAQARKTWLASEDYLKIRSNLVHHLIDAAVLAHIPPREGMNHVACGGIFYTEWETVKGKDGKSTTFRLLTKALPELSPAGRLKHWFSDRAEYAVCPVLKLRSNSKTKSLGRETFWRQVNEHEPILAQREVLNAADIKSAESLLGTLKWMEVDKNRKTGNKENKIPSREQIDRWLTTKTDFVEERTKVDPGPLRLTDGTPIKSVWKPNKQRNLDSPAGLSGKRNLAGALKEIRVLDTAYDRIEIWLGYDHKLAEKARKLKRKDWELAGWKYQKRLIPDATALEHLKQMGFSFGRDKRKIAPDFMQAKPGETKTVREIVLGRKLLPFSKRVGILRKDDLILLKFNQDGEIITNGAKPVWTNWYRISASGDKVEMKCAVLKETEEADKILSPIGLSSSVLTRSKSSVDEMAFLAGCLPAAKQAAKLNLRVPLPLPKPASEEENGLI